MRPITVSFLTRPIDSPNVHSHGEPVDVDGWAQWHAQTDSLLMSVLLSAGKLVELWIGTEQQLAVPIRAEVLMDMASTGVRLPLPVVRAGVVVRAKVIPPPDPGPDGPSSGR